jgi:outer membrane protein assembly factor BamB
MTKSRRLHLSYQQIRCTLWAMVLLGYACFIIGCDSSTVVSQATRTIAPAPSASSEHKVSVPECAGDEQSPKLMPGWKLVWQHTFDNPLALPPAIDGSQVALLERADPIPNQYKDTVWMLDAATSSVQWHFDSGAALNLAERWIDQMAWSPKHSAFVVHDSKAPREFVMVFDRLTGQIVYQAELQALEMAISDDALFYRSGERRLYRIDLPSGKQRWQDSRTDYLWKGLRPAGEWLYAFIGVTNPQNGLYILKYKVDSGALVNSVETSAMFDIVAREPRGIGLTGTGVALFDLSKLTTVWETDLGSHFSDMNDSNAFWDNPSRVTLTQDAVYLFDAKHSLVKITLADGKIAWTVPFSDVEPMSKPAALAGVVYGFFSDGSVRAFSEADGAPLGNVMKVPLWYWTRGDSKPFRNLVGGVGVANDTLIVTTGCRSVYAIRRDK